MDIGELLYISGVDAVSKIMKQDIHIINVGTYTHAQCDTMALKQHAIGFNVRGLRYFSSLGKSYYDAEPSFLITPADVECSFEYDATRENHVVLFEWPGMRVGARAGMVEWWYDGQWVPVHSHTALEGDEVALWLSEWRRMRALYQSPVPENMLQITSFIWRIVGVILQKNAEARALSPAEDLRCALDRDVGCEYSIEMLSRECGYSPDHMRQLFHDTYGMSPRAYRMKRRLAQAKELMGSTHLTVKEVAHRLGFKHVSHFSMLFRAQTGQTPTEAIRQYRQMMPAPERG